VIRVASLEGDSVEPGALLAALESPELAETQAAVLTLEAEKHAAAANLERESALVLGHLSTPREAELAAVEAERYENLLRAARRKAAPTGSEPRSSEKLGRYDLRSPVKGEVVERNVAPGQTVVPDTVAFRIADPDHLCVKLDVYERNLVRVHVGDPVELRPLANKNKPFEGRVARVSPLIDGKTRSAPVRVEISSPSRLRAGQPVSARIQTSARRHTRAAVVPTSSITLFEGKPRIFVKIDDHAVRMVPVQVGVTNGPETEVARGVEPGDEVVSAGVFALKSELFR
jgi:cobalt-zinc-cadmium efflux system membrane fusion protein